MHFKSKLPLFVSAFLALSLFSETLSHGGLVPSKVSSKNAPINTIYAFGDSYTDGGTSGAMSAFNLSKIVMTQPPAPPKPPRHPDAQWLPGSPESQYVKIGNGRWTNGPTAVEVLATEIGASLTNYAVGGATTGEGNYCTWLDSQFKTGLLGQIAQFDADKPKLDSVHPSDAPESQDSEAPELFMSSRFEDALFSVFASANDYFKAEDEYFATHGAAIGSPEKLADLVDQSIVNTEVAIRRLAQLGAKRFLVVGSTDLSIVPWEVTHHRTEDAQFFTETFNARLLLLTTRLRQDLEVEMTFFDHAKFSETLRLVAKEYGLTELNTPCTLTQNPDPSFVGENPICKNPEAHYFWDEYHTTQEVGRLAGRAMKQALGRR